MNTPALRHPSLRRHLLFVLLVPLSLLLLADSLATYLGALAYANHVHDRDLSNDNRQLVQMVMNQAPDATISPQANFLLEYDPNGRNFYSIVSARHGLLAGNPTIQPPVGTSAPRSAPMLFNLLHGRRVLRAAAVQLPDPSDPGDQLTITVAESMHDRREQAREILLLTVPTQAVLLLVVLALVWFGVGRGLRLLDPLTARLAAREHDLTAIGDADVPVEIRPLTRTIDGLFARLRRMLELQDRFIADAAHQLRTPLAGLRVHAERAQQARDPAERNDALAHIVRLIVRASRTSSQLLALTRAQSPEPLLEDLRTVDLAVLVPELVKQRVHEAIAADVDLGYEGHAGAAHVHVDRAVLQELLDNLIDNALRYAGAGSEVTVRVEPGGDAVRLAVEDNGPGVPPALLGRLGERFFRVPGQTAEGSGLGLAIVQRMAERHGAKVSYANREDGGLRVEIAFPHAPAG